MKGKQITSLAELIDARNNRRAVICKRFGQTGKPMPAAVMLNQQGWLLHRIFREGMWLYEKPGPVVDAEYQPEGETPDS